MSDFISKAAFGFIMAQLVPGAILAFSLTVFYVTWDVNAIVDLSTAIKSASSIWSSTPRSLLFLAIATACGMIIHGVHWCVIGTLEHHFTSIFDLPYHRQVILFQICVGTLVICYEIIIFILSPSIRSLRVEENIPRIDPEKMTGVEQVHSFYLHFSQFYAHTAIALLIALFLCFYTMYRHETLYHYWYVLLALHALVGLLFVIGRAQLASLFNAEMDFWDNERLLEDASSGKTPPPRVNQ